MRMFQSVQNARPGRSVFDLSHQVLLTCDMGQLIPVLAEECIPGDRFQIGNEIVIRFMPLVAPILHEISASVHYFFCPYRILDTNWEGFITGGVTGGDTYTLPVWDPVTVSAGSLWDYFGFPVGIDAVNARPLAYPQWAYNAIYNAYYRDETQTAAVALTDEAIKVRGWEKDYFTSALPWQQRGTAPGFPISGTSTAVWDNATNATGASANTLGVATAAEAPNEKLYVAGTATTLANFRGWLAKNTVNLGAATTFNVADIRLAFRIQEWMERNARAGARYTEFLKAHYGVSPRDDRLQRPEYIGGSKSPVVVSEVLQTSQTGTTPQGNMAGHGLVADVNHCASYTAQEFGVIIGILSVMPKPIYQQGIDRMWLHTTRYDFYSPEFANLSEQAILRREIYASSTPADNIAIWGYQGKYDEYRVRRSRVSGLMGTTLDYWHLSRQFGSAPALNTAFIECVPRKDIFAAPSEPGLIVSMGNKIRAVRPMPVQAQPGGNRIL